MRARRGMLLTMVTLATLAACTGTSDQQSGAVAVPVEARAVDSTNPATVIGTGTPSSCDSAGVVAAVARGGVITFDCGPDPLTIFLRDTAKVVNDAPDVVLDGGGKVTLSGAGERRILYLNTCDAAQKWTTSHCDDQEHPSLTVQNLTMVDGNATGEPDPDSGGGAIFARGGRLKIVNSTFRRNRCDTTGPDVGGGAVRALDQFQDQPVYVVSSTFGGAPDQGNVCSNGGALSSIGVSWTVLNSVFSHNKAIGRGANPPQPGSPGGGNGGAIYNDGNQMTLHIGGSVIEDNAANEGGGAIFFVSNDHTGTLVIESSILRRNTSGTFETAGYPGIFFVGAGTPAITSSPAPVPAAPPSTAVPGARPAEGGPTSTPPGGPRHGTVPSRPPGTGGPRTGRGVGPAEPVTANPVYSG